MDDAIQRVPVEYSGHIGLLHVLQSLHPVAGVWFNADHLDGPATLLQCPQDAHGRSRCAEGENHGVHFPVGLFEYLGPCAVIVCLGIGGVVELIGHEIAVGVFPDEVVDFFDGAVRAEGAWSKQQFGAEGLEDLLALEACCFRHGEEQPVAFDRGDNGKSDPGVSARSLDDDLAGSELSFAFGGFDHVECGSVLDGTARIPGLDLDIKGDPGIRIHPVDADKGCLADAFQDVREDILHVRYAFCNRRVAVCHNFPIPSTHKRRTSIDGVPDDAVVL